jgi:hypothetical protein
MEMNLTRLVYSFVSFFLKAALLASTVFIAFRANAAAAGVLSAWLMVPFCALAIYGSKCAGEAIDELIRRTMGWEVEPS